MRSFRLLCPLLFATLISLASSAIASEPYKARVKTDQVFTRSGPGENYYPTSYLEKNTIVEVFQEDAGGWLAIRPTRGEFSLIAVDDLVYGDEKQLAKVRQAGAASRVGSQISDQHHVVHVKLDEDEQVEVLGIVQFRDPKTGQKEAFYRIDPPAGEFRWINKHFIEPISVNSASLSQADRVAMNEAIQDAEFWKQAEQKLQAVRPVSYDETTEQTNPARITGDPQPLEASGPLPTLNLIELELAISKECLKPAEEWNFKPLKDQAKRLIEEGETPLERGKARLLLEKIEQFIAFYERMIAAKVAYIPTSQPLGSLLPTDGKPEKFQPSTDDPAATFSGDGYDPRYDGKGWLMPVITRASAHKDLNQYTPPFALTDSQGNVLQFVSPSPGLNLRRYARMQVGIYGQISPLGQLTKPHLTAHRIVVLSRHEKQ